MSTQLRGLGYPGEIRVSRTAQSAQGEMAWTVSFPPGTGNVPTLEPDVSELVGTDAVVRVSTLAHGLAEVGGTLSLIASGVEGEVR